MNDSEAIQDSLKEYVSIPKQKYQEMDLLVQTFGLIRDDLTEMGILDKGVAPLFYTESIANNIRKLIQDQRKQVVEQCARVSSSYDSKAWNHSPAFTHVADMVSIEIANNIRKTLNNG